MPSIYYIWRRKVSRYRAICIFSTVFGCLPDLQIIVQFVMYFVRVFPLRLVFYPFSRQFPLLCILHKKPHIQSRLKDNSEALYRLKCLSLEAHGNNNLLRESQFTVLRKCQSKFDCLVFEMLFIKKLKPNLNIQTDSIRAKLFV